MKSYLLRIIKKAVPITKMLVQLCLLTLLGLAKNRKISKMRDLQTKVPFAVRNDFTVKKSENTWQASEHNAITSFINPDVVENELSLQIEPPEDPEFEDLFSMLHYLDFENPIQNFDTTAQIKMTETAIEFEENITNGKEEKNTEADVERKYVRQQLPETNASLKPRAILNDCVCTDVITGTDESDTINPPAISPATLNWLHSLASSSHAGSWNGHTSPLTISSLGSNTTPSQISPVESPGDFNDTMYKPTSLNDLELGSRRSLSCECIDWKSYNESKANTEHNKGTKKWRVIPQHRPPTDPVSNMKNKISKSDLNVIEKLQQRNALSEQPPKILCGDCDDGKDAGKRDPNSMNPKLDHDETYSPMTHSTTVNSCKREDNGKQAICANFPTDIYHCGTNNVCAPSILEEKNKRKAIVSPEFDQYKSHNSNEDLIQSRLVAQKTGNVLKHSWILPSDPNAVPDKLERHLYVNDSSNPARSTRRPSKRIVPPRNQNVHLTQLDPSITHVKSDLSEDVLECDEKEVAHQTRCKCTGRCRNARCACVKAGALCGHDCKCFGCLNPFRPMAQEGIPISVPSADACLIHSLSKIKDMKNLLNTYVTYSCCESDRSRETLDSPPHLVKVKETIVDGFTCPSCSAHFTFSWCGNRLCHDEKKPRKHCIKCRRCVDHRNQHCDDCNRCYFAGVANSFPCNCKKDSSAANSHACVRSHSHISKTALETEESDVNSAHKTSVAEGVAATQSNDSQLSIDEQKANQIKCMDENDAACPVQ